MNVIKESTYEFIKANEEWLVVDFYSGSIISHEEIKDKDGYLYIILNGRMIRSHHIISYFIFGERMIGAQINHIDGEKSNNSPRNLETCTPAENARHAFKLGLKKAKRGEDSSSSKVTEADVVQMRKLRTDGATLKSIGEKFGLSIQQVSRIVRGERWSHVKKDISLDAATIDFDLYQKLAQRTANDTIDFDTVANYALGLVSEAAEVTDEIKKQLFHGHDVDQEKIKDELSDVMWYLANLARKYGLSLKEIAAHNVEKLKKRYPDGFSEKSSVNRIG